MYDRKYQEYRTSQKKIKSKINYLDKADKKKLPLYDVFRHLKQEITYELSDLRCFLETNQNKLGLATYHI